eukprot:1379331-Amorphochlora_amoeboformis.AAC.1
MSRCWTTFSNVITLLSLSLSLSRLTVGHIGHAALSRLFCHACFVTLACHAIGVSSICHAGLSRCVDAKNPGNKRDFGQLTPDANPPPGPEEK